MSSRIRILFAAVLVAAALAGCLGHAPASEAGRPIDPARASSSHPQTTRDRFFDNWTEEQRMLSDHTIDLPGRAASKQGNAINVSYLANATPTQIRVELRWAAKHDLQRKLELEDRWANVTYVGPSPLQGVFEPNPGGVGYEYLYFWLDGEPAAYAHEMTVNVSVSVLYRDPGGQEDPS